ncbi:hypothetical protein CKN73_04460 [Carnobacterium divergens]|uniref:hypothetical protein n=1 Tax=Carnobacterium divergens TaxID=2748 RepID=UPI0010720589|nr:hypothetical protein [Carnobacterium divergens]TFJ42667.1 hypothetical protein CKN77_04385 [Carnobacterium divergens]TFJ51200.1 hypothetical protein CKN73_04460 [Carnobacterium divergens]TFJ56130.1 hypothetical protein CKN83_04400 [Carnobacterium divergens]TFJ62563.1 hypothetical protein CKN89_04485 [Carnobacterium divergens]TFJ72803.1 hypothetical protein CKN91_04405 [Carnobacterium divergens]
MGKLASSISAASIAVKGVQSVSINSGVQVYFDKSSITSMKTGEKVNNQLLSDLSQLIDCVKEQSQKFPKIAEIIAIEDSKFKF